MSRASWGRFLANHSPVVWWIMAGLAIVVVLGIVGAIVTTLNAGETGEPANGPGAVVPPAADGTPGATASNAAQPARSAVAGVAATAELRVEAGGFAPGALTVPRGSKVLVAVAGRQSCILAINGEPIGRTLAAGDAYTWSADNPGHYEFTCAGTGLSGATVLVP